MFGYTSFVVNARAPIGMGPEPAAIFSKMAAPMASVPTKEGAVRVTANTFPSTCFVFSNTSESEGESFHLNCFIFLNKKEKMADLVSSP